MVKKKLNKAWIVKQIFCWILGISLTIAAGYSIILGGKFMWDTGEYFLQTPTCVTEQEFVFDDKVEKYAIINAKGKDMTDHMNIVKGTCAEFTAKLDSYEPDTWYDILATVIGCIAVGLVGIGTVVFIAAGIFVCLIDEIRKKVANWINAGEPNKKYE